MDKIRSVDQCKELISANKKRFPRVDTNCLTMASGFAPQIGSGRLYYEKYENGLGIYLDEGAYYNLHYFWNAGEELDDLRQDKPVLVEELDNRGRRSGYIARMEERLCRAGFSLFKTNSQYELRPDEAKKAALREEYRRRMARLEAQGYRMITCATQSQAQQIYALWDEYLEPTDFPLEHRLFMSNNSGFARCVVDAAGEVAGIMWWRVERNTAEDRHLVTREEHNGKGIGTALIMYLAELLDQNIDRVFSWVSDDNAKSIHMHRKIGFDTNGKTSVQYILQGG